MAAGILENLEDYYEAAEELKDPCGIYSAEEAKLGLAA